MAIPHESPLAGPVRIGPIVFRNRILMAPVTTNYADLDGRATDKTIAFYEERARGGAGGIIFEACSIGPHCRLASRQHGLHDDSLIPGLAEVTRRIHAHGSVVFAQIAHGGAKASSAINGAQPVSSSVLPVKSADIPRPISAEEIDEVVENFGAAALRAREAGFDGVELHAAHFYLLSCFLSAALNDRIDEYGGTLENRARLTLRVVRAVKERAGFDYPVICRIHGRESLPGGIDEFEARGIARILAEGGADAIHVSAAILPINPKLETLYAIKVGGPPTKGTPAACYVPFAASIKSTVRVPVIAVGKLNDPAAAESAVTSGSADLVGIARGLIADPYLPEKLLAGRWEEIQPCTDCLTCHTTMQNQYDMGCSVNPKPWIPKGPRLLASHSPSP